jgi:hypothetical protein
MWTTASPFLPKSYSKPSLQCANHSCNEKSFPAIPNMPGSIGPKWFGLQPRHNSGSTMLQLVIIELQYVLHYVVMNKLFGNKQLILVFLFLFSVALSQNTTGVITATTMAAAGKYASLVPHIRPGAPRQRVKWMGNNPLSLRMYFGGG